MICKASLLLCSTVRGGATLVGSRKKKEHISAPQQVPYHYVLPIVHRCTMLKESDSRSSQLASYVRAATETRPCWKNPWRTALRRWRGNIIWGDEEILYEKILYDNDKTRTSNRTEQTRDLSFWRYGGVVVSLNLTILTLLTSFDNNFLMNCGIQYHFSALLTSFWRHSGVVVSLNLTILT